MGQKLSGVNFSISMMKCSQVWCKFEKILSLKPKLDNFLPWRTDKCAFLLFYFRKSCVGIIMKSSYHWYVFYFRTDKCYVTFHLFYENRSRVIWGKRNNNRKNYRSFAINWFWRLDSICIRRIFCMWLYSETTWAVGIAQLTHHEVQGGGKNPETGGRGIFAPTADRISMFTSSIGTSLLEVLPLCFRNSHYMKNCQIFQFICWFLHRDNLSP